MKQKINHQPTKNKSDFKVGQLVSYHPFAGQAAVSSGHEITATDTMPNNFGENVAWITGKAGCFSFGCLSLDPAPKYIVRDSRSNVGTNMQFWCAGGKGYTTNINNAGRYSLDEATSMHKRRDSDIPMDFDVAFAMGNQRVDMQYLDADEASNCKDIGGYVLQAPERYDGNDILFITSLSGETSFNYQDALVLGEDINLLSLCELSVHYKIWPKAYLDGLVRTTLQDTVNI